MTPINFVYWLQGFFELEDSLLGSDFIGHALNAKFYDCVSRHLKMCQETPGNFNPKLVSFLYWVEAAIEFEVSREKIAEKLHDIFEHVIDPMTTDAEVAQNQSSAHGSGMFGRPGMKC